MVEEELLPPTAGDCRQRLVNTFCGLNHEIRQLLDLQEVMLPLVVGACEFCDAPHTFVRQWNGMLQQPAKQQLKTFAGIRQALLAIVEFEETWYAQWLMELLAI